MSELVCEKMLAVERGVHNLRRAEEYGDGAEIARCYYALFVAVNDYNGALPENKLPIYVKGNGVKAIDLSGSVIHENET